jgi:hypothetical protein
VTQRVVQQVVEQLGQQQRVAVQQGQIGLDAAIHPGLGPAAAQPVQGRPPPPPGIPSPGATAGRGLQPGQLQGVVGQPAELLGLLDDGAGQALALRRRHALALRFQRRGRGQDGGQRRAVVVRDRRQQGIAQALGLLALPGGLFVGRRLGPLAGRAPQVAQGLQVQAQRLGLGLHGLAPQGRSAPGLARAAQGQHPEAQALVVAGARPHGAGFRQGVAQGGAGLVIAGFARDGPGASAGSAPGVRGPGGQAITLTCAPQAWRS